MTVGELEREYKQARELLLRGEIGEDAFKAAVEKLRFDDGLGRQWKLGWYTGRWYRYEHGEWVRGEPEGRRASLASPSPAQLLGDRDAGPSRRFFSRWLVAFLTALLLLTSVVLVTSLQADWWDGPLETMAGAKTATRPATDPVSPAAPTAHEESSPVVPAPSATEPPPTPTAWATSSAVAGPRPQQTLPAPLPQLRGRIYYPVYDNDPERLTFDIYAMQLDTGQRELVVAQASQPALSPEGQRLAYRSWKAGEPGIAVLDLEDSSVSTWVDEPALARPSWSPDGLRLLFCAQQGTGQTWRIVQATDSSLEALQRQSASVSGQVPVWLADGRIVYRGCLSDSCGLNALGAEGKTPEPLTTGERDTGPAAAPAGGSLAFMSDRNGNWDIYLLDTRAPGDEPLRLTDDAAREGLPTWSPDGQWLAFASDRDGAWAVWIMRPDGTGQHRLFSIGGPLEGNVASLSPHVQPGWTWETMAWGP
jgi:hypothetical protein